MNGEVIIQVGTALIALIGAVISYIIIPYIKARTTVEQQNNILFWVNMAVNAAEQIYHEKGQGQKKKQYVIEFLHKHGINANEEQLDLLIEAAVHELNKNLKIVGA